ncbi:hypothetical protein [uncultured Campylobacter sp.]|nr:hypothetical protein [uncultured Campylobacter sp.]
MGEAQRLLARAKCRAFADGFENSAWSEQNFKIFTQMSRILKFLR